MEVSVKDQTIKKTLEKTVIASLVFDSHGKPRTSTTTFFLWEGTEDEVAIPMASIQDFYKHVGTREPASGAIRDELHVRCGLISATVTVCNISKE